VTRPPLDDLLATYRVILALWAVGATIGTLEWLAILREFRPDGLYTWRILRLRFGVPRPLRLRTFGERSVRALLLARLAAIVALLLTPLGSVVSAMTLALLVVTTLAFTWRRGFGDDGSDRMNAVVLLTAFLCVGPHSTRFTLQIGLWFIALQACLAYATAGFAKLRSPSWRDGEALVRVFSTETYGFAPLGRRLAARRGLARALAWTVIAMETLFPLCLVLPAPWGWAFLAWGVLFHLLSAVLMGFNTFVWAFVATYPAIVWAATAAPGALRIDSLPTWR
jgi:hypothetical protein